MIFSIESLIDLKLSGFNQIGALKKITMQIKHGDNNLRGVVPSYRLGLTAKKSAV